jgi:hypothetical protein
MKYLIFWCTVLTKTLSKFAPNGRYFTLSKGSVNRYLSIGVIY